MVNLKIATRRSKLAQVQTDSVIALLSGKFNVQFEKLLIETLGDKILDRTLDKIGGKGLFVKDIEIAMLEERAHGAVHSMKDVPYEVPEDFEIAAITLREDVRDVFISLEGTHFKDLRKGAKVGTSSRRRAAQLKMLREDLEIVPIRGNVQTRIEKIKRDNLDGIILAAAGLKRLDLENIITDYFTPFEIVPAVGQGALGIETKKNSQYKYIFESLNDEVSRICVEAERSFMKALKGDCHSTIGAYASIIQDEMNIIGIFEVGGKVIKKDINGSKEDYINLGKSLAEEILKSQ